MKRKGLVVGFLHRKERKGHRALVTLQIYPVWKISFTEETLH